MKLKHLNLTLVTDSTEYISTIITI